MAVAIPLLMAAGSIYQGARQSQADKFNSQVMANEKSAAINQANAQEGLVRRASRESLGRQVAAFGGAGVGYGGSTGTALSESAVNQELDALNTRYKGAFTGYGYGVESDLLKQQSRDELGSTILLAGSKAMEGVLGVLSQRKAALDAARKAAAARGQPEGGWPG